MLIRDKGHFFKGLFLIASFFVLLGVIFLPIFSDEQGHKLTGLQYADQVFNQLSKGSSYFIPQVRQSVASVNGQKVNLNVKLKRPELAPLALKILQQANANATLDGATIRLSGDLGLILTAATNDGDALYQNQGEVVAQKYSAKPTEAAKAWWYTLTPMIQELQKERQIKAAEVVDQVLRRAIEPGNNFYSITPVKVADHVLLLTGLLAFYLLYTLWYGFGIFELFEGLGLAMSKSKH